MGFTKTPQVTVVNGYSSLLLAALSPDHPWYGFLGEIHKAGERAAELTRCSARRLRPDGRWLHEVARPQLEREPCQEAKATGASIPFRWLLSEPRTQRGSDSSHRTTNQSDPVLPVCPGGDGKLVGEGAERLAGGWFRDYLGHRGFAEGPLDRAERIVQALVQRAEVEAV